MKNYDLIKNPSPHKNIITGPYLLAPTSTGITIVWEASSPEEFALTFNNSNEKITEKPKITRSTPCFNYPEGTYFYHHRIENLKPDTRYSYSVHTPTTDIENNFKTLPAIDSPIKFLFVSDTHNFFLAPDIEKAIQREAPDLIIHGGDLLVGSALQKEQYQYWFRQLSKTLQSVPVIYTKGNHDDGPYFDDYFSSFQARVYKSDPLTLCNIGTKIGPIDLIIGNSNPWSLEKMNAEKSGLTLDPKREYVIQETLKWIDHNMSRHNAAWSLGVFHHHYLDAMNESHLIPILNKHPVDFILSGHIHFFQHAILPHSGLQYFSIGDSVISHKEFQKNKYGHSVMPEKGEILAKGQCDYAIVEATTKKIKLSIMSIQSKEAISEHYWDKQHSRPTLSNIGIESDELICGKALKIQADLTNTNPCQTPATATYQLNGQPFILTQWGKEQPSSFIMEAHETIRVECTIPITDLGKNTLTLGHETYAIDTIPAPATLNVSSTTVHTGEGILENVVYLKTSATNTGHYAGHFSLQLSIGETVQTTTSFTLSPNESKGIELSSTINTGGFHKIHLQTADDQNLYTDEIFIPHFLQVIPQAQDQSGHKNHAWLIGSPVLKSSDDNQPALYLNGKTDYIEIPDHPSLNLEDNLSTQIDANVETLQGCNRYDHFALFNKGPSIVYGPNYLLRLAVKETGALTAGVGFNTEEYHWDGGQVETGIFQRYAASFSKKEGGKTLINGQQVAQIAPISDSAKLRTWSGYPIIIGLAFIGYVEKQLGRAKYYSLLKGAIKSFKFYNTALQNKTPLIDLDFNHIKCHGSYTSESIQLTQGMSLEVTADIPENTSIQLNILTTDSTKNITTSLKSGKHIIFIDQKTPDNRIKFSLQLTGSMRLNRTALPGIHSIKLLYMGKEEKTWETSADWKKGSLEGAIGFNPKDRLKEYTDDGSW